MDTPSHPLDMKGTLRQNIDVLAERHRREIAAASFPDKIARRITGFVGSMAFVLLHCVIYSLWIGINLGVVPGVPRFDSSFVMLAMEASVEAIFLSTFVLITQNRMADAADRRADLDLHINLLAEHELTKLAELVDQIARKHGIEPDARTFSEVESDVRPAEVIDALDARSKAEEREHGAP